MEKILEALGLKKEATEEEAVAKVKEMQTQTETLKTEKSKLEDDKRQLSTAVESEKVRAKTLEDSYKQLLDSQEKESEKDVKKDIIDELATTRI